MMRAVIAVVVGYVAWTAIWLGGNAAFFGEAAEVVAAGRPYDAAGALAGVIGLSVVCSLVAGFLTAKIAAERARGAVLAAAIVLLLTGIGVQMGVWDLMPAWYHLTFLALVVPFTILGGRWGGSAAA